MLFALPSPDPLPAQYTALGALVAIAFFVLRWNAKQDAAARHEREELNKRIDASAAARVETLEDELKHARDERDEWRERFEHERVQHLETWELYRACVERRSGVQLPTDEG